MIRLGGLRPTFRSVLGPAPNRIILLSSSHFRSRSPEEKKRSTDPAFYSAALTLMLHGAVFTSGRYGSRPRKRRANIGRGKSSTRRDQTKRSKPANIDFDHALQNASTAGATNEAGERRGQTETRTTVPESDRLPERDRRVKGLIITRGSAPASLQAAPVTDKAADVKSGGAQSTGDGPRRKAGRPAFAEPLH